MICLEICLKDLDSYIKKWEEVLIAVIFDFFIIDLLQSYYIFQVFSKIKLLSCTAL